jgi:hypothetical protein
MAAGNQAALGGRHGDGDVRAVEEEGSSHTNGDRDVPNHVLTARTQNLAVVEVIVGEAAQRHLVFQSALCTPGQAKRRRKKEGKDVIIVDEWCEGWCSLYKGEAYLRLGV